jgi:GntR family transcriptional regulator/MocR family aminotransferase
MKRPDDLTLELDDDTAPLFLRVARAIVRDIERGRLLPGDPLPGTRPLARGLGVHRNTVLAAYRELSSQGWIEAVAAQRTQVSRELPTERMREPRPRRATRPRYALARAARPNDAMTIPPGAIPLLGGVPDLRLVPTVALARAYRRALARPGVLGYGDPAGQEVLRTSLAVHLARARGLSVTADDILVTRGSQMALDLLARNLLGPGDVVAVESLGYRPAWTALSGTGATLAPIAVDRDGIRVDRLAALIKRTPVRAVYVTPHHQYPTTVTLGAPRRLALLDLARRHRFAIIEDDYDHEFHYDGRPVLPIASRDDGGSVIYIGTLSKVLAPGLRLGWIVAPPPLRDGLIATRVHVDRQGDQALERAVAELLDDGEVQRHALRMRRLYRQRRDAFASYLQSALGDVLEFDVPAGGMALWARAPGVDVSEWSARAASKGVLVQAGSRFTLHRRPCAALRLGYASVDVDLLARAVDILVATRSPTKARRR